MITKSMLDKKGIKYKRPTMPRSFRWLPATYRVETREFDNNGELMNVSYPTYLALWEQKLNQNSTVIEQRDDNNRIVKVSHYKRYLTIKTKRDRWFYTLVELEQDMVEDFTA